MTKWTRLAAVAVAACVLAVGCGGTAHANETADAQCFTNPTPEERAQFLETYGKDATTQTDETICVIEGGTQRYVHRNDGFSDYLMYSLLFGRSNALLGFGVLSGDLDIGDALALSLLTGVNGAGGIFHPYGYSNSYGWGRQPSPTIIQNVHVTNVQYGNAAPQRYTGKTKPPAAYKTRPIPKPSKKVATVGKDATGKPVVTPVKKANASKIVSGKAAPPAAVKNAQSTATTIANPSRSAVTVKPPAPKATKPPTNKGTQPKASSGSKTAPKSSGSKSSPSKSSGGAKSSGSSGKSSSGGAKSGGSSGRR